METMGTIITIIGAVIQVIALIVFFVLASNMASIKKEMPSKMTIKKMVEMAEEEKYIGNKEKAREYYLRAKYHLEAKKEDYPTGRGEYISRKAAIEIIDKELSTL